MLIVETTGSTSKKGLVVDKPIGKLILEVDGKVVDDLTIEKIFVTLESKTGQNENIHSGTNLKQLIEASQMGEGSPIVDEVNTTMLAGMDISLGNGIALQDDEIIKIDLEGLNAAHTYRLYGYEVGVQARNASKFEVKSQLLGDAVKNLTVAGFSQICIDNFDKITSLEVTFNNGYNAKYTNKELEYIMSSINDFSYVGIAAGGFAGKAVHNNYLTLVLSNAVNLQITSDGTVKHDILLRTEISL